MSQFIWLYEASGVESSLSVRLALTLFHFLWQGCVIALIATFLSDALARASAAARYRVNVIALVLMACCLPLTFASLTPDVLIASGLSSTLTGDRGRTRQPAVDESSATTAEFKTDIVTVDASMEGTLEASTDSPVTDTVPFEVTEPGQSGEGRAEPFFEHSAIWFLSAYLVGVALMLFRLTRSMSSGYRLVQSSLPAEEPEILSLLSQQAERIGLAMIPAVRFCHGVTVPTVIGLLKPVVLLPMSISTGLNSEQLAPLLAHELGHIRRLDLLVNVLQRLVEAFLFFHPAVWFISRRVSIERENACDDLVVAAGCPRMAYADALLRMAEVSSTGSGATQIAALAASGGSPSELKRRVLRVVGGDDQPRLGLRRMGVTLLIATAVLTMAAPFLIPSSTGTDADPVIAAEVETSGDTIESDYEAGDASIEEVLSVYLDVFKSELAAADSDAERIRAMKRRIERLQQLTELENEMRESGRDTSKRRPPAGEAALWSARIQLDGVLAATSRQWRVLDPQKLEIGKDEEAQVLDDRSVLFNSPGPKGSDSWIVFKPGTEPITHLKFEALTHKSLPGGGPGRSPDGTFLLFGFDLYHITPENAPHGEYVELRTAFTDHEEPDNPVDSATDFLSDTCWIAPSSDFPHVPVTMVTELYDPLQLGPDDRLAVKIDAGYRDHRTPGRVRISVASDLSESKTQTAVDQPDKDIEQRIVRVRFTGGEKEEPLPGLTVIADSESYRLPRENYQPADQATTDANGAVTLELPIGRWYLRLKSGKPIPWLVLPHGYEGHPAHFRRSIKVSESEEIDEFHFNLAPACELSLRVVDQDTGQGVPGVKLGTENALAEMWMHVLVPECIGANRPIRYFELSGRKEGTDLRDGDPPESDYQTDADGFYRVHVGPRPGWAYMIYTCPDGYQRAGFDEVELETPAGGKVEYVFKVRRKAASSEAAEDSTADGEDDTPAPKEKWGHLKGRFVTDRSFPGLPRMQRYRDTSEFGDSSADESLLVDRRTGGIANVAVYLRSQDVPVYNAGDDLNESEQSMTFVGPTIHPRVVPLMAGQQFVVRNSNRVAHNAHIRTIRNSPFNFLVPVSGQVGPIKFEQREPIPAVIGDAIHPTVRAWLLVCDHPYMSVSKRDGSFEIRNLPPGELEFQCWHERVGHLPARREWERGRFTIDVTAGETIDLGTITIPLRQLLDESTQKASRDAAAKRVTSLRQFQGRWEAASVIYNRDGKRLHLASWPPENRQRNPSMTISGETITGLPRAPNVETHLRWMETGTYVPVRPVLTGTGTVNRNRTPTVERLVIDGLSADGKRMLLTCLYRMSDDGALELALQQDSPHIAPTSFDADDAIVLRFKTPEDNVAPNTQPRSSRPRHREGAEAIRHIREFQPAWGDSVSGIQIGLIRRSEGGGVSIGERLPLEYCIRNVGSRAVEIQFTIDFYRNAPEIQTKDGVEVNVETSDDDGATPLYGQLLPPDGAVVYQHYGVGIGQRPADSRKFWHPHITDPGVGEYALRQTASIKIRDADTDGKYQSVRVTSGSVPFSVVETTE